MNKQLQTEDDLLPLWLRGVLAPLNTNFDSRACALGDDAQWQATDLKGVQVRLLECVPGLRTRLVGQLKLEHGHEPVTLTSYPDIEALLQKGQITSSNGNFAAGCYFRIPHSQARRPRAITFERASSMQAQDSVVIYFAAGQMKDSDRAHRIIDINNEENWLPGPIEGIDVMPLHGHGSGNVMLLRWNKTAAFKTRIDPLGEELLVLNGAVYDSTGLYEQNSWIRNPIEAWQPWGAKAGTVVYYKNGHFAHSEP